MTFEKALLELSLSQSGILNKYCSIGIELSKLDIIEDYFYRDKKHAGKEVKDYLVSNDSHITK